MRRALAVCCASSAAALDTVSGRLLRRVKRVDAGGDAYRSARDFVLNGEALGKVLPQAADALKPFLTVTDTAVTLDAVDATAVLKEAFDALRAQDAIPMLRGWRDEPFAIRPSFAAPARAVVERAAAPLLGAPAYGVFCTAYVPDASGAPAEVWLGRRSKSKPTWPGLLDSVAAGGLAAGELPRDAMAAECQEEAGVAEDLLRGLRPVGAVSYTGFHQDRDWAVKPDTLFCFDLAVPKDWEPRPVGRQCTNQNSRRFPIYWLIGAQVDGEVESFEKITVDELIDRLVRDDDAWKPNVGLVLTDFLVRHGRVPADDAEYLDLIRALRNGRCA